MLCALTFGALSLPAQADSFTASDVLEWEADEQDYYFETSIAMAGVIASQNDTIKAGCIDEWYFGEATPESERRELILQAMTRFPDHHPAAVLLAVINRKCGSMRFRSLE